MKVEVQVVEVVGVVAQDSYLALEKPQPPYLMSSGILISWEAFQLPTSHASLYLFRSRKQLAWLGIPIWLLRSLNPILNEFMHSIFLGGLPTPRIPCLHASLSGFASLKSQTFAGMGIHVGVQVIDFILYYIQNTCPAIVETQCISDNFFFFFSLSLTMDR